MTGFLRLFYQFLKVLINTTFPLFYRKISFINKEVLAADRPYIVVSNHPSTMMDPLHVASKLKNQTFFLANASLFKNPILGWILDRLYCIQIQRPKDVEGGRMQNSENFAKCDAYLAKKGCLYIAPEGSSFLERRLREVKTGTARIALSAESKQDFQLGLTILPVGLTYEKAERFRQNVVLHAGELIKVSDWKVAYQENPVKAVRDLTEHLEEKMQNIIIHTKDEEQDQLLYKIEAIVQNEKPVRFDEAYWRSKKMLKNAAIFENVSLKNAVNQYFQQLDAFKIGDFNVKSPISWGQIFVKAILLIVGLPVFLFGFLSHLLPIIISEILLKTLKLYIGYNSNIKYGVGLIFVPLYYWIQSKFLAPYFDVPFLFWIFSILAVLAGLFAWEYHLFFKETLQAIRYQLLKNNEKQALNTERNHIVSMF